MSICKGHLWRVRSGWCSGLAGTWPASVMWGQQRPHMPFSRGCRLHLVLRVSPCLLFLPSEGGLCNQLSQEWNTGRQRDVEGSGNDVGSTLPSLPSRLQVTAAGPSVHSSRHVDQGSCLWGGDRMSLKGQSKTWTIKSTHESQRMRVKSQSGSPSQQVGL